MADVVTNEVTRIYENTNLTVTARIDVADVDSIEEVTFKFLKDGKQFEEKAIPVTSAGTSDGAAAGGGAESSSSETESDEAKGDDAKSDAPYAGDTATHTVVSHTVKAPAFDDDTKSFYFLDYHYFYKVKSPDGTTESLQNFPSNRIQVFPRTAQLKVVGKDGKAFHGFEFRVEQDGQLSEVCKTLAADTPNAKGEAIPAGSCEFNLGLHAGFRIVPYGRYRVVEDVKAAGRKREIKGEVGFRAKLVAPAPRSTILQCVDYPVEQDGQHGIGHEVTLEVGVHKEDLDVLPSIPKPEIHFRVTYGPPADAIPAKSARDDKDHPTKVRKPSTSDTSVTIEEKEANKKYEGKVALADGMGKFVVGLGKAGGDTCKVEIAGSADFLTKTSIQPDEVVSFENWRRVHYELMVPDILREQLDESSLGFRPEVQKGIDELGRLLFIEFVHDSTQVFNAAKQADYGALAPRSFIKMPEADVDVAYVLTGRNWRKPPEGQAWAEIHPGKSLYIAVCDRLYKWRQDTADPKAGTKDLSGTLKEAIGSINVEEKFEGYFMPFSGHDAGAGVAGIHWTADISKDDAACKYKPELTIKEDRYDGAIGNGLGITLEPGEGLPAQGARVVFQRLPYPRLEITDKTEPKDKDDGKLSLKEPVLGKELALEFEMPKEEAAKAATDAGGAYIPPDIVIVDDDEEEEQPATDGEESAESGTPARHSFSEWGRISKADEEKDESSGMAIPVITDAHRAKLDEFFKALYKDGKAKLGVSAEANKFSIEIHGGKGDGERSNRIAALRRAIVASHDRTHNHDQYDFKKDLATEHTENIQAFVDALIADRVSMGMLKGKLSAAVGCPKDAKHGVDDCFKAVKDKLKELFDAKAKEFAFHPGLDAANEDAPREGDLDMAAITDVSKSSPTEWHFVLPAVAPDGTPGPAAFIGPSKTADQCPVKFELSFQPHEQSLGEADGKLIAWPCSEPGADKYLAALILQGFAGTKDAAAVAHGHGDKGKPGDCLAEKGELCEKCIAHGRSRNLTQV